MTKVWCGTLSVLFFLSLSSLSPAMEWGPWSSDPGAPLVEYRGAGPMQKKAVNENSATQLLLGAVSFFQKYISPVDGPRCAMAPTCSHYSLQAIIKHGPLLGFMMSADRIVHEYEEQRFVPQVWDGKSLRFYDPVEYNDFWFTGPSRSEPGELYQSGSSP